MHEHVRKWIPIGALTAAVFLAPTPASAQFEEPDTVGNWSLGPFIEATIRGTRGTRATTEVGTDPDIDYSNGPAFGVRLERRLGGTVALGVLASFARSAEQFETGGAGTGDEGGLTLLNLAGEMKLKVKPQVPGYFVFGGGVRFVFPDADEVRFGREDDYLEPMGVVGLGIELLSRRNAQLRAYGRLFISATAEQPGFEETNSLSTDIAAGLIYLFRL